MRTWVKICGITNRDDAELALRHGADALGFVFHARSPRYIRPSDAKAVIEPIAGAMLKVGVWLDEPAGQIEIEAEAAGIAVIQTYDAPAARTLIKRGKQVLYAFDPLADQVGDVSSERNADQKRLKERAGGSCSPIDFDEYPEWRNAPFLLDVGRSPRDTTIQNPNSKIQNVLARLTADSAIRNPQSAIAGATGTTLPRWVLAGGLTPENLTERLCEFRPPGVDVASGVEAAPGRKDPARLQRFMEGVRQWDAMAGSAGSADALSPKR